MIKYFRLFAAILILCLVIADISGQVQTNALDIITDKFLSYCKSFPREEIYIHTDRHEYIAGESMWFKILVFDRQSSKLSGESQIAYFEILNPENRPVVQERIRINNGSGPGQVVLPDTISSGKYTIRAYTNWMKNFMPDNCFTKSIAIYNALNGKSFTDNSSETDLLLQPGRGTGSVSQRSGLRLEIDKSNPGIIDLVINTDGNFRSIYGNTYYIFIQTHGMINFKSRLSLSGDVVHTVIPGSQLILGINHITIFSSSGRPLSESFMYTPVWKNESVVISSADNYGTREKVELTMDFKNETAPEGDLTNLSISVSPQGYVTFPSVEDYMIFGSEFGTLPAEFLKSDIDSIPEYIMNNLLSVIKSNWIIWNNILSGEYPVTRYKRESEYHFLYGRLLNKRTQIPDPDQYLFLSIPGKNASFQYARTNKDGNFTFTLQLDENFKDLIIQPEDISRNNNIRIESSFSDKYSPVNLFKETSSNNMPENISKMSINYQVMKIYGSDIVPEKLLPVVYKGGTKRFYGKPDIELIMDDYIKLPVMQEVFFELMPGVFLRKKKSEYEISIVDPIENRVYEKPPLLLVDGVVVKDPAIIANLDPELVEKIDAVNSRYFIGDYLFYGLVNVITRTGDFSSVTLPDFAIRLPYRITEPVDYFSSPDYSSEEKRQSRIPDFRNTLCWNPSVKPDAQGKARIEFWASDFRTDFEINVQGISGEGELISFKKIIKVQ